MKKYLMFLLPFSLYAPDAIQNKSANNTIAVTQRLSPEKLNHQAQQDAIAPHRLSSEALQRVNEEKEQAITINNQRFVKQSPDVVKKSAQVINKLDKMAAGKKLGYPIPSKAYLNQIEPPKAKSGAADDQQIESVQKQFDDLNRQFPDLEELIQAQQEFIKTIDTKISNPDISDVMKVKWQDLKSSFVQNQKEVITKIKEKNTELENHKNMSMKKLDQHYHALNILHHNLNLDKSKNNNIFRKAINYVKSIINTNQIVKHMQYMDSINNSVSNLVSKKDLTSYENSGKSLLDAFIPSMQHISDDHDKFVSVMTKDQKEAYLNKLNQFNANVMALKNKVKILPLTLYSAPSAKEFYQNAPETSSF